MDLSAKKRKTVNAELEEQIEKQNKELFVIYDKLKGVKEHDDLLAILNANNQYIPADPAEVRRLFRIFAFFSRLE